MLVELGSPEELTCPLSKGPKFTLNDVAVMRWAAT
jgi:hypothetical protein